ncbi:MULTISPECIES: DUF2637 domain-containing protein [unclassified Streptomyces]|uniref:DUF2637 domain-containing protein n=1 Tax=unclassified Streptomyces TaxID=2593676 RepID=UPI002E177D95|nr:MULTISPECIES: DUF2637 domain-containing protein [unclassified Streptomyces]
MTTHDAERYALILAGVVIIALTAGAFWLSYAHLADVAGQHGLGASPIRRWAWPATLDAFIVAGELLMLRAALRRVTDRWAIGVTAVGSAGSIALNVAGVGDTGGTAAPILDYVVAAVPPAAAMVAFGVLMRQVHQLVEQPVDAPEPSTEHVPDPSTATSGRAIAPLASTVGQSAETSVNPDRPATWPVEQSRAAGLLAAGSVQSPEPSSAVAEGRSRGGRPPGVPLEDLVEIGRAAVAEQGKLTRAVVRTAVEDKKLTVGSERLTKVMEVLRAEQTEPVESGRAIS